jgi:uncharacterized membrane protein
MNSIDKLALLFFLFAFLGWVLEVIYAYFRHKKFVNRGFLKGPLCPVYGIGMTGMVVLSNLINQKIITNNLGFKVFLIFIATFLFTSILEYITGFLLELFFHQKWWDYSEEKFNLKGRVCLKFSIYWGILGLFIIEFISIIPENLIKLTQRQIDFTLLILIPIFIIDIVTSIDLALKLEKILKEINEVSEKAKDKLEENAMEAFENVKLRAEEKTLIMTEMMEKFKNNQILRAENLENRFKLNRNEANLIIEEFKIKIKAWDFKNEKNLFKEKYILSINSKKYKRWLIAFPKMKSRKYNEGLKELKKWLKTWN